MPDSTVQRSFAAAISGRALLEHPFYQRWQHGGLRPGELGEYAEQYRHFERNLPDVLAATADHLPNGLARDYVTENLADERFRPRPHVELFESFAAAVGARPGEPATPATRDLVGLYRSAAERGPGPALAVIGAYEVQAAAVAETKANGLRVYYGLAGAAVDFWDVHGRMEHDHADWTMEALVALGEDSSTIETFAAASAEAWWAFLDERNGVARPLCG